MYGFQYIFLCGFVDNGNPGTSPPPVLSLLPRKSVFIVQISGESPQISGVSSVSDLSHELPFFRVS